LLGLTALENEGVYLFMVNKIEEEDKEKETSYD
jgi:hypothetical protein